MPKELGGRGKHKPWYLRIPESGGLWTDHWRKFPVVKLGRPGSKHIRLATVGPLLRPQGIVPNANVESRHNFGITGVTIADLKKGFIRLKREHTLISTFTFHGWLGQRRYRDTALAERMKPYDRKKTFKR